MALKPVVRHMILCDDWHMDPFHTHRINVVGLLTNIESLDDPPYPLLYREICILLLLTEGHGQGLAKIVCVEDVSGPGSFPDTKSADRFLVPIRWRY